MTPCPYTHKAVSLVAQELDNRKLFGTHRLLVDPDAAVLLDFLTETGSDHLWSMDSFIFALPSNMKFKEPPPIWLCWIVQGEIDAFHASSRVAGHSTASQTRDSLVAWLEDPCKPYDRIFGMYGAPENLDDTARLLSGQKTYVQDHPCWRLYPVIASIHGI